MAETDIALSQRGSVAESNCNYCKKTYTEQATPVTIGNPNHLLLNVASTLNATMKLLGATSTLFLAVAVYGQSCSNYGVSDAGSCLCPPGFGGSNCAQPGCGGTLFDGSKRTLAPIQNGALANLTSSDCTCPNGWTGTGCNVCNTASACQAGYVSVHGNSSSITGNGALGGAANNTLVCNASPQVYAAGELSCDVNNPTLRAIYPLQSTLNILRTLNASLSPLSSSPGTTLTPRSTANSSSVFAQLFYAGVEQFYCSATSCNQSLSNSTSSGAGEDTTWSCSDLACTCVPGTTFCGGAPTINLTATINSLGGTLVIACDESNTCHFKQSILQSLFGSDGLTLQNCVFGECVSQGIIEEANGKSTSTAGASGKSLSGGVIAGLAVVGSLIFIGLAGLVWGWVARRRVVRRGQDIDDTWGGVSVQWRNLSYFVPSSTSSPFSFFGKLRRTPVTTNETEKTVLDNVSGYLPAGSMMGVLGPSGAGKTTLVEILALKQKSGIVHGTLAFPSSKLPSRAPNIAFVPQQDILPAALTVHESLLFAASLRLPESFPSSLKHERVWEVMEKLGLLHVKDTRIGDVSGGGGGGGRGISGGEARRVSIGLELVGRPDILVLDEPTSGLDSVSAMRVGKVLYDVAHDAEHPTAVIASIHQPSSQLYHMFDSIALLSHGRALYMGDGGFTPVDYFSKFADSNSTSKSAPSSPPSNSTSAIANAESAGTTGGKVKPFQPGYNPADYLLEIASEAPVGLFPTSTPTFNSAASSAAPVGVDEKGEGDVANEKDVEAAGAGAQLGKAGRGDGGGGRYVTTFLTQLEVLSGREWKILRRDKTLFFTHTGVAAVLGVFCGGLYYQTGLTIAGFQSRVGCLFFLGALIAFSSLSALYNIVEIRPLFLRERSNSYYSPTAWLLSRFLFDVIPLRIIPTIIVSTVTYWMAGLTPEAAHFFKFLFILVLYSLAMALFNFLLGTLFRNGGIAILISALSALYQMTYAGFFVHLNSIPPVLRWLQWLCPLKFALEALSVNEVGSGLMIKDTLQGVPVNISAVLIMEMLFGFGADNYYRDVLVLFAYIAGFGLGVIGVVWFKVRERR